MTGGASSACATRTSARSTPAAAGARSSSRSSSSGRLRACSHRHGPRRRNVPKTSRPTKRSRTRSRRSTSGSIEDALEAIARAAKRVKLRWYLFGAQAVALHGVPRTTQDIDVTVLIGELPASRLVDALAREGLVAQHEDEAFLAATRVIPTEHAASGWRVDVVLGGPGLEEEFLRQAVPRKNRSRHRAGAARRAPGGAQGARGPTSRPPRRRGHSAGQGRRTGRRRDPASCSGRSERRSRTASWCRASRPSSAGWPAERPDDEVEPRAPRP